MAMNFSADADALIKMGTSIEVDADNYDAEIKKIYAAIDNLGTVWKGDDNQAYVSRANEYRPAIGDLGKALRNQGRFLSDTGKAIKGIKQEIQNNASNM